MKKTNRINLLTKTISRGLAPLLLAAACVLNAELFQFEATRDIWVLLGSRLLLVAIVLIPFFQLKPYVPWPLLFMGEVVAIGFSWCPTTYLYVYASYLFMTLGVLCLYFGLLKEKRLPIFFAGLAFGVNVFLRIMNFAEISFVVVIWYVSILMKDKKWIKRSLLFIGGFCSGLLIGTILFFLLVGVENVRGTLSWLSHVFTFSRIQTGAVVFWSMLKNVFLIYYQNLPWFLAFLALVGFGNVLYLVKKDKGLFIKRILFVAVTTFFMVWYAKMGVMSAQYKSTNSFFSLAVVFIMLSICIYVLMLFLPGMKTGERTLGLIALIILLIAPLGSNNHLFTCMNQLYLVAPITIVGGCRLSGMATKHGVHEPLIITGIVLLATLMVQAVLFRCNYVFYDIPIPF